MSTVAKPLVSLSSGTAKAKGANDPTINKTARWLNLFMRVSGAPPTLEQTIGHSLSDSIKSFKASNLNGTGLVAELSEDICPMFLYFFGSAADTGVSRML